MYTIRISRRDNTVIVRHKPINISVLSRRGASGGAGATGPVGPKGDKGDTGDRGLQGERGLQGPIGLTGADGAKGDTGAKGDKGDVGASGAAGPRGFEGPQGERGIQGTPGVKGDTGERGLQGLRGEQGIQGERGPQGDPATNLVTSVAGKQGAVTLNKADVGLNNVDNTSDINKPISNATKQEIDSFYNELNDRINNEVASIDYVDFKDDQIREYVDTAKLSQPYRITSTSTTLTDTDSQLEVTLPVTISLLTAVNKSGRIYDVINSSAGNVVLQAASGQTIGNINATNTIVIASGNSVTVVSNGSNWRIK